MRIATHEYANEADNDNVYQSQHKHSSTKTKTLKKKECRVGATKMCRVARNKCYTTTSTIFCRSMLQKYMLRTAQIVMTWHRGS